MNDIYRKLIDMYAGRELSAELEEEMVATAKSDPELAAEMRSLRAVADSLRAAPAPEFTEESYQRVLMKVYARGVDIQKQTPDPAYLQYHLPIQG